MLNFFVVHDNVKRFPKSAITDNSMDGVKVLGDLKGYLNGAELLLIQCGGVSLTNVELSGKS